MAFVIDPEIQAALTPIVEAASAEPTPPPGDWKARRAAMEERFPTFLAGWPARDDVVVEHLTATAPDGAAVPLRLYRKRGESPGALVVYAHGGGMIAIRAETYDPVCSRYVAESGVPVLSVDYRLAPEHPHPTPAEDCFAALRWAAENADALGVDPARIAIMGDSAGGGLAAATALMARDRGGPALAAQILIYPMLDDRTTTADPELEPFALWTVDDNVTGWAALLGHGADGEGGPDGVALGYAAPARATDLSRLPFTYIEVGQIDIFRAEDVVYAERLARAGVNVELHVHPGAVHAFDHFASESALALRARAERVRVLRGL